MADVLGRYVSLVDDVDDFRAACDRPLPMVLRVNTIKSTVTRAIRALEAEGVSVDQANWNPTVLVTDADTPGNTWAYFHGFVHGQEEVSSIPATALDPQPGERVFDACAAPGSKTTHLSALMDDTGVVVANDNTLGRLSALRSNTERLGITNVIVTNQDARNYSLKPFAFDAFDRALVDAPCSCEGTVRKNPTVLDEWTEQHVTQIADVQKAILRRAIQMTRPGGVVVYSTCTFAPEENEAVIDYVLEREPCRVVPFDLDLDSVPGVTEWNGEAFDEQVTNARRVYPHHNDTGGFFTAKLEVEG